MRPLPSGKGMATASHCEHRSHGRPTKSEPMRTLDRAVLASNAQIVARRRHSVMSAQFFVMLSEALAR
jgi:hypothetical protein